MINTIACSCSKASCVGIHGRQHSSVAGTQRGESKNKPHQDSEWIVSVMFCEQNWMEAWVSKMCSKAIRL